MQAIEARSLRKTYVNGVEAVRGLDLEVAPGETFGLLGPNGAGKSTTVGMLTTTIRPTSGSARVGGYDVVREPLAARAVSSVVFQEPVLDAGLSGRAHLELHARLWGSDARRAAARIADLTQALDLTELVDRPVRSYSGGQRRRLELARALVSEPKVLFMDEPTVGLDPRIRHELLDLIARLRTREEVTILLTTHYLDEAERLCDRVAIMHAGEVAGLDHPRALRAALGAEILEFRVDGDPETALAGLRARGVAGKDAFAVGARVTIPLHDRRAGDAVAAIDAEQLRTSELAARAPTLDDVYLRLTGAPIDQAA